MPEISPKPTAEKPRWTYAALLAVFNLGVLRLMGYWPWVLPIGVLVNIMAVCVHMGVKVSKGE